MRSVDKATPYPEEYVGNYIRVKTAELLSALEANQATHRATFEEAWDKYEAAMKARFKEAMAELRKGRWPGAIGLPIPQDHTRDYDRVITMVRMTQSDLVELQEADFARFVMDDWEWKREWATSNSFYGVVTT
jgi:protein-tyrosine-phosphatase